MARTAATMQQIANAEKSLADHVPYSSEIAPGVIKLKGGNGYLCTFEIEGVPYQTSSEYEVEEYNNALHQFLTGFSGGGHAFWVHKVHMKVRESLDTSAFTNEFSKKLAVEYQQRLAENGFMRTTLYLTVLYRPGELATFKNIGAGSIKELAALERQGIDQVGDIASRVMASLKRYKPRQLKHVDKNGIIYSEAQSFLHFVINGFWLDIPYTHRRVDESLCSSRLTAGQRSGVLELTTRDQVRYVTPIEIKEYPEKLSPLSLSPTLYLDQEYIETQSFSVVGNREAIARLRKQRGQLLAGGEASEVEMREFDNLIEDVTRGLLLVGEYHYNLSIFSDNLGDKGIKEDRSQALKALEDGGFRADVQTVLPEAGWFFQMPGNWRYRTRGALLTSRNFVCLSPLHNFMAGKKSGNPWGEALCVLDSPSGQPFYFNFHCSPEDHDSTDDKLPANTCIFGKTGVGKTTTEMFLMSQLNKYGCRIFVLDLDRSTEITVRRMGGNYKTFARGKPTGLNPFQWPDTPRTRAFCRKVVTQCMTFNGQELSVDEANRLATAIDTVFGMRPEVRRLGILHQLLPNVQTNSLQARLSQWTGEGDLAWVLDNPTDTLSLEGGEIWGFDYSDFIDDAQICPIFTMCLLHIFEDLIDGRPIALFMEEFWKLLGNPVFSHFVRDKLKTIRKENGFVVMTTQQPDDVLATDLAKTAVQQHVTGIYLPNPNANYEDYVGGFGVTEHEFELIRALPTDSRAILIKQESKSAIVRLDLGGMPEAISVLSGDKETVEMLESIRVQVGDDPAVWEPIFIEQVRSKRQSRKRALTEAGPLLASFGRQHSGITPDFKRDGGQK